MTTEELPTMAVRRCALGPLERVPLGEGRCFRVAGVEVAVFRSRDGSVHATQAACPHRAGPLADGLIGGGRVVCPLHGYAFELETGSPVGHACPSLRTYSLEVTPDGGMVLELGE